MEILVPSSCQCKKISFKYTSLLLNIGIRVKTLCHTFYFYEIYFKNIQQITVSNAIKGNKVKSTLIISFLYKITYKNHKLTLFLLLP